MLKPSLQNPIDIWYSRDPAFNTPARADKESDESWEKRAKEWDRLIEQARETGMLDAILIAGERPTLFTVKPMRSEVFRKIADKVGIGTMGHAEASAIAFRACIVSVSNLGDVTVKMTKHEDFGTIATTEIVDLLDGMSPSIVSELGGLLIAKASGPSPK